MKSRMLVHVSMDMNIQKDVHKQITNAFELYKNGEYRNSLQVAEQIYSKAPSNVDNHILLASIQFQLRNLSAAIFYCQQAIRIEPNCAEAFCIMGNCLKEMNDLGSAVNFFHKSIRFNPRFADVYNNLGLALFLSPGNKTKESLEAFQVAASLDPSHCDSLCNIGTVSKMLGRNNFAKEKYLEAIRIQPQCAIAWSNLGGIFVNHGDYSQAVNCYRHALNVMPNFPDALSNSGNAIFKLGKEDSNNAALVERVAERYEKALSLRPDFALSRACYGLFCFKTGMKSKEDAMKQLRIAILQDDTCFDAMNNLAALYFESGRLDDSLKLLLRVLKRKPEHWCAFNNLGNVLREMGMFAAAALSYQMSLSLNKTNASSHSNTGTLLLTQNRDLESFQHFENAMSVDPISRCAYMNMGVAYLSIGQLNNAAKLLKESSGSFESFYNLAVLEQRNGNLNEALKFIELAMGECRCTSHHQVAITLFGFLKASMCDWSDFDPIIVHTTWCTARGQPSQSQLENKFIKRLENVKKIRIGYVLPTHSVGNAFNDIHCVHDPSVFDVFPYFIDTHAHVRNIAPQIAQDRIHILVYVTKLLPGASYERLAPIQISLNESDYDMMDYIVSSQEHSYIHTKSLVVPGVYHNIANDQFDGNSNANKDDLRSRYGISDDIFVYGCFQAPQAISSQLFDVWMNILKETEDNTCILLVRHNDQMEVNLKTEAEKTGVDPDRLIFVEHASHLDHLKRYSMIDLYLDSCIRSGRTAICEALLSGSPAICIQGESPETCYGANILSHVALDGLVVKSLEEYKNLAITLQSDEEKFIEIIRKLDDKTMFPKKQWVHCYEKGLQSLIELNLIHTG